MGNTIAEGLNRIKKGKKKKFKFHSIVLFLSTVMIISIGWIMRIKGFTIVGDTYCGIEEHKHSDTCYDDVQICTKEEHIHDLLCYADKNADIETADMWEKTLPKELSGIWEKDLIAVAESQIGYRESEHNYTIDSEGSRQGYTRYGQWYHSNYNKWDAMFVSWCLHYAGIRRDIVPTGADSKTLMIEMDSKNLYQKSIGYVPKSGDIVFMDLNNDGEVDQTGIVSDSTENTLKTIEGDSNDSVQINEYGIADQIILGYCSLPQNPELVIQQLEEESEIQKTDSENKDRPFYWDIAGYDYVYLGDYKNSYNKIVKNGENHPISVGTKVLIPENAAQPWSPDNIPWIPGNSNYQLAYPVGITSEPVSVTGYKKEYMKDTQYFTQTQKESLIKIIKHSYPFISEEQMIKEMKEAGEDVSGIHISEIMSGTQQAIWKITNGIDCVDYQESSYIERTDTNIISPLQSNEIGEVNGLRAQKAAQRIKKYLLNLPDQKDNTMLEIKNIEISNVRKNENGVHNVCFRIILNRPIQENDKNLKLIVSWNEQEKEVVVKTGDEEIEVCLNKEAINNEIKAKLTGEVDGFWEIYHYIGHKTENENAETSVNLLGGYSYVQNVESEKQLIVSSEALSVGFPKSELTKMIDESNLDWNRLIWEKPTKIKKIFGSASEFGLFALNDFNVIQGSEIIGPAAVGGIFNNRGKKPLWQIGHGSGGGNGIDHPCTKSDLNFLIGDHVDGYFKGDIWGWLASRNYSNLSSDGTDSGVMTKTGFVEKGQAEAYDEWYIYGDYVTSDEVKISTMLDSYFENARKDLVEASETYRNPIAGTAGDVEIDSLHNLKLTGTDKVLNFFEVTVEQINTAEEININVPKDAYVQVNIIGNEKLRFKAHNVRSTMMVREDAVDPWGKPIKDVLINAYDVNYHQYGDSMNACRHLFWNMPDITEIVTETPFAGSILAPKAHLQVDGVNVNGSIIVNSATLNNSGGEFHYYPFDYENWPNMLPKTSVKVMKKWIGDPAEQAEIELVANGVHTGKKAVLNRHNNWTYIFTDLPAEEDGKKIEYKIVETDIPGYSSSISGNAESGFIVTNTKIECELKIKKQSSESTEYLQGAEFKLYQEAEDGTELLEKLPGIKLIEIQGNFITDEEGSITISNLLPGIYYVVETKAPEGYKLLENPICITLSRDNVSVEADNELIKISSENMDIPTLIIKNKPSYKLPETGGTGTLYYTLGGILLMAVPLMYYVRRTRNHRMN